LLETSSIAEFVIYSLTAEFRLLLPNSAALLYCRRSIPIVRGDLESCVQGYLEKSYLAIDLQIDPPIFVIKINRRIICIREFFLECLK
jgi:hypothetical protein